MQYDAPPGAAPRRLLRSRRERMFAGVAGGLADYFDLDPVVVRLLWIATAILTGGLAIPAYIVMMLVMPKEDRMAGYSSSAPTGQPAPEGFDPGAATSASADPAAESTVGAPPPPSWDRPRYFDSDRTRRRQQSAGIVLIALGLLFLAGQSGLFWWINFKYVWPLILIAVGVGILLRQGAWRR